MEGVKPAARRLWSSCRVVTLAFGRQCHGIMTPTHSQQAVRLGLPWVGLHLGTGMQPTDRGHN